MNKDSFYITLPSNSSMSYFPNNTTTSFCTQLPRRFDLHGNWEIGLVEFHYPQTFENVSHLNGGNLITVTYSDTDKPVVISIGDGVYTSQELIQNVNTDPILSKIIKLSIQGGKVTCERIAPADTVIDKNKKITSLDEAATVSASKATSVFFAIPICKQLGFNPGTNFIKQSSIKAKRMASEIASLPNQIFIYCDLIDNQYVGDSYTKLLRNITVDKVHYVYGNQKVEIFDSIHYIPLAKNEFEDIKIDLRSETGETIAFAFGLSIIKVHFRRVSD